ncbi:hypothetical protein PVK06_010596 [Gossypium arboreum]|uniref:Reverse transcriptase zinc-binding domain-containing protein n=2 Tax=Gossypium arboreum TaxID=29729 RepID=A0ABR0Q6S1_GOSAR|nr:hypothetical protein PVK06_010596 [Gossypium arboreum]
MVERKKNDAFQHICDRMKMKVQSWGARLLSQGGKEVFIKTVLQAIPTYSMSCFLFPKTLCTKLESIMSRFWWQKSLTRNGMHWCNWANLNIPKNYGGMGFRDLGKFNIALLVKQGWRLVTNPNSLLGRIYKAKHYPHTSFWNATLGTNPSYTWKSIFAARKVLEDGLGWKVGSGSQISILQDCWLPHWAGGKIQATPANSRFDRVSELIDYSTKSWKVDLISKCFTPLEAIAICYIPLSVYNSEDRMVWFADNSGRYTVRSGYRCLVGSWVEDTVNTDSSGVYKKIWELNLPPKIRIIVWQITKDYIPTAVNLYNRRISSSPSYPSYSEALENFMHTLLVCGPAKDVWQSMGVDWSNFNESMDFCTWINLVFQDRRHDFGEIATTTAWALWQARNKRTMEGKGQSAQDICSLTFSIIKEMRELKERIPALVNKMNPIWMPPQEHFVKVNFDAAFRITLHQPSSGFIIRNSRGQVMGYGTIFNKFVLDSFTAEAIACLQALDFSRDKVLLMCK